MRKFFRWLEKPYLAILLTCIVLILTLMPSENIKDAQVDDKFAHFLSFGALTFLWLFVKPRYKFTIPALLLLGYLIEVMQWMLPLSFHRSYDLNDVLADAIGVALGAGLYWIVSWLFD